MLTMSKRLRGDESGFTLIELLIVMIIIGILASIAIPTFLGQKKKAVGTKMKANIMSVAQTIESCASSDPNGDYTNCGTNTSVTANEPSLSASLFGTSAGQMNVSNPSADGYTITGITTAGADQTTFIYTKSATGITKTCPTPTKMCPSGTW